MSSPIELNKKCQCNFASEKNFLATKSHYKLQEITLFMRKKFCQKYRYIWG